MKSSRTTNILLPLLIVLACGPANIATEAIAPENLVVIEPSGVNLQSAPRADATIIGHLKYLQSITVTAESEEPDIVNGKAGRWFRVEQKHGIPATTGEDNPEIWVFGFYLEYPGKLSGLETGYKIEISDEQASRCCYEGRPTYQECLEANPDRDPLACDPGEACEGGGSAVRLEYGWTPTPLEWATDYQLQSMVREGIGPPGFRPLPFPCNNQ